MGSATSEIPKAEAEAEFGNKTGWSWLLFHILFLMCSSLDSRGKNPEVWPCAQ